MQSDKLNADGRSLIPDRLGIWCGSYSAAAHLCVSRLNSYIAASIFSINVTTESLPTS